MLNSCKNRNILFYPAVLPETFKQKTMKTDNKLRVEVWSDIVCPFCYIGKRHFEKALAQFEHADDIELEFKAYQLDPGFVQDSDKKHDLIGSLAQKYGRSIEQTKAMLAGITASAQAAGLNYDFDNAVTFNTRDAHRIAQMGKARGLGDALEERFFASYFVEGKNLGDREVLRSEAIAAGLTAEDVEEALSNEKWLDRVNYEIAEAAQIGVRGVPFFVLNRRHAVSGAQPVASFLEALTKAHSEWLASQPKNLEIIEGDEASCDIDGGNC